MLTGSNLGQRIRQALALKGVGPTEVARLFGIKPASVSGWMTTGRISKSNLFRLMDYCADVVGPEHWGIKDLPTKISDDIGSYAATPPSLAAANSTRRVPLISWTTAGHWGELIDNFQPGDADEWVLSTAAVGEHAFALRIVGDSMEPTIPNGATVIVDPDTEALNNRVVIVRQNGDTEATCKRLVCDGGTAYLKPDNSRYPVLQMRSDAVICGVVRQVLIDLN